MQNTPFLPDPPKLILTRIIAPVISSERFSPSARTISMLNKNEKIWSKTAFFLLALGVWLLSVWCQPAEAQRVRFGDPFQVQPQIVPAPGAVPANTMPPVIQGTPPPIGAVPPPATITVPPFDPFQNNALPPVQVLPPQSTMILPSSS